MVKAEVGSDGFVESITKEDGTTVTFGQWNAYVDEYLAARGFGTETVVTPDNAERYYAIEDEAMDAAFEHFGITNEDTVVF